VERFPKEGNESTISRSDLDAVIEPHLVGVLSMLLQSDSPFLAGFQGGEQDDWTAPVDDRVVNYWDASSIDDFLRIRAEELRSHPQLGWSIPWVDEIAPIVDVAPDESEYPAVAPAVNDASSALSRQLGVVRGERGWKLGDQLNRGGMGQVFEADGSDPPAVVKLVPKAPGAERELLFANPEGVPNVVPIWDKGEWNGYWFIVMPRADCALAAYLAEHGALSAEEALLVLTDIADALVGLDGQVVHRDIKPDNILLLAGRWCLADFGIARYAEATTAAETRKWAMTPPYAAPEQWRHERATSATDIYAVGVIAYELLTGELPFAGTVDEDFREAHLHEPPPDIPGAPPVLASLVSDCLNKSPGARPKPSNFLARLERAAKPSASTGLASLQSANSAEAQQLGRAAAETSQQLSEAQQRQSLLSDAVRSYSAISDALFEAVEAAASSANAWRDSDVRNWRITLGRAKLTRTREPLAWSPAGLFDLVLIGTVAVSIDGDPHGYRGRAHSLWFADAQQAGTYQWFETGFGLMALTAQISEFQPFPLDGGDDAALALLAGLHTHQVAWPFTPLTLGDLEDFIDRWAGWLAAGSEGRLQRVSGDGGNAQGSWRRA
jgi:serine/threonine-protein kinase